MAPRPHQHKPASAAIRRTNALDWELIWPYRPARSWVPETRYVYSLLVINLNIFRKAIGSSKAVRLGKTGTGTGRNNKENRQ